MESTRVFFVAHVNSTKRESTTYMIRPMDMSCGMEKKTVDIDDMLPFQVDFFGMI